MDKDNTIKHKKQKSKKFKKLENENNLVANIQSNNVLSTGLCSTNGY